MMNTSQTGFNSEYTEDAPTLDQVNQLAGSVILEFGAPWCGHCQTAEPLVKKALSGHTKLPHIKIYDGKGKRLGRAFKIKLWPTLVLLQNGKEVKRLIRPIHADEVSQLLATTK